MAAARALKKGDIVLALFVTAIAAMLLFPLPTTLLDLLLVVNLAFSFLLLLAGLYMPNALALLAFPTMLLLSTLFRLSLNVASTRLILSDGDAGKVIQAFGTFLIRGEVGVGLIIFIIITVVNFIVIARGSSRVSEVAARFALDALPGKQMAIDSDMRSGLLTAQQAQQKREELRKESQLYGAMDGAMKFVQGDAVAGVVIIITNILAGFWIGVAGGMGIPEAVQAYTTLTVGDGLVHQIPALLISICAGLVVTRVSSGENTTLGTEVSAQLFTRPGTMVFAGTLLILVGIATPLPILPFTVVGAGLVAAGWFSGFRPLGATSPAAPGLEYTPGSGHGLVALEDGVIGDGLELEVVLDSAVLFKLYRMNQPRYEAWWRSFRNDFTQETGLSLPELRVSADERAAPSSYSITIAGSLIERDTVLLDAIFVEVAPESASEFGLEVLKVVEHPISGSRVFWAPQSPQVRRVLEAAGVRSYDFFEYIGLRCGVFFTEHPEESIGAAEVFSLLKGLEKRYPGLLSEGFQRGFISVPRLTELLHELARDGVSLRDFKQLVEGVAVYCTEQKIEIGEDHGLEVDDIVSFLRLHRKRQLVNRLLSPRRTLRVLTLADEVVSAFAEGEQGSRGAPPVLEPELFDRLGAGLRAVVGPLVSRGIPPVSIVCRGDVRAKVAAFARAISRHVRVVSLEELDPSIVVEPVGTWRVD